MNCFKIFLSRRWTGILFTLISIIASNCWQQILANFDFDNSFSISAARNISEGHGYSIKMASTEDFSKFYFEPLNKWPPGHSWLLWLIHKLFLSDWIYTTYILNALGLTALVLIFRKMLFQLGYPAWIVNPCVLFFGFFQYTFHYSNNSDMLGLLFYLSGLSVLLNAVRSEKKILPMVFIACFLLGSSVFLKYLYIPLAFIPILSLQIYGYLLNRKDFRSAAIRGLFSLSFIIFSLFLFQFLNSGKSYYINPSKTGFFPEQLLWLAPVVPASLMNLNFINMQISIHSPVRYESMQIFWSMVNMVCLAWLFYGGYKIFQDKVLKHPDYRSFYVIHAILFTVALFGYLSVLSVIKGKNYPDTFSLWVYVGELRYYIVFSILLIQFAILVFQWPEYFFNNKGKVIFQWMIIFILVEEIGHGAYFCIKQIVFKKNYGTHLEDDRIYFNSIALVKTELARKNTLVFCSNAQKIANMAALEGLPVLYDLGKLKMPIQSSRPITLIIAVDKRVPDQYAPLLKSQKERPDYFFDPVKCYIVNIPKTKDF